MSVEPVLNSSIPVMGETDILFYNDEYFSKIREKFKCPNDILKTDNFDIKKMAAGGGKGGDPMCRTTDGRYFVKLVKDCDHDSLIEHVQSYSTHVLEKETFLVRIFMHFKRPADGLNYLLMNSCLPVLEASHPLVAAATPANSKPNTMAAYYRFMDLKGCCDDKIMFKHGEHVPEVHKRFWKMHMNFPCLRPKGRDAYYSGKVEALNYIFHFAPSVHAVITGKIKRDTELMSKLGLMDYSLIVGIIKVNGEDYEAAPDPSVFFPKLGGFDESQPYLTKLNGDVFGYYIGIIDFLQAWTMGKKIAHCIKCTFAPHPISTINPKQYAKQFFDHFDKGMVSDAEEVVSERVQTISIAGAAAATPTNTGFAPIGSSRKRIKDVVYVTEV